MNETGTGICNTCGAHSGIGMIAWAEGWDYLDAKDAVADVLGMLPDTASMPQLPVRKAKPVAVPALTKQEAKRRRNSLLKLWQEGVSTKHPVAEPLRLYLARRGLPTKGLNPEVFRFHPGLLYYSEEGERQGKHPALLTRMVNEQGRGVTIHRTYLTTDGEKAVVEMARKICLYDEHSHSLSGSAVHLTQPGRVLSVGEGIETMLSVLEATQMPTWATTTASLLASLEMPDEVEELWIWADKDRSRAGETFARKLCERAWAEGRRARIILPHGDIPAGEKSLDWNDILRIHGVRGFPRVDESVQLKMA
ncbi:MAG: toprim domain-containing protein [Candidatus Thiodiazotropha lotti]|nr:toprim domain-containing protein [Candidatus Thiodiazotropha lotti]